MNETQIHQLSDVKSSKIGYGTRIWQYCVIFSGAKIGEDCNICAHVLIEDDVEVGDNVTIKSGVQLWNGVRVGNNVFIGPNVTFTNDFFPRSKLYPDKFLKTEIGDGASIGANATILPGISIGSGSMIGAGSVVTRNVPSNSIVAGNPASIIGYTDAVIESNPVHFAFTPLKNGVLIHKLSVGCCALYQLPQIPDIRGNLCVAEYEKHIPFIPKRYFWVFDVPSKEVRGEHAHKKLHQYLICIKGYVSVVLDDGVKRIEVQLNQPNLGLHIPPGVWGVQYKYSSEAVLLVLASEVYDSNDYLRNYDDYLNFISRDK